MFTAFPPLPSHCCFRWLPTPFTNSVRVYLKQYPKTKGSLRRVPDKTLCQNEVFDVHLKCSHWLWSNWRHLQSLHYHSSSRERTLSRAVEHFEFSRFCVFAHVISPTSNALSSLVHLKKFSSSFKTSLGLSSKSSCETLLNYSFLTSLHPIPCHRDPLVNINHPLPLCFCSILYIGPL